jgi:hypothetical protein
VHGEENSGEVAAQVDDDHPAGHLKGHTRLEARLEVGAQRVAHERRARECAAAVAGDVAEDEAHAATRQGQHVVEVPARPGSVRRPVGDRRAQRAHLLGHRRQQGALQQADLLEQLAALLAESLGSHGSQQVADAEQNR